jgi:membrane protein YqaA with SNARE-associated domain
LVLYYRDSIKDLSQLGYAVAFIPAFIGNAIVAGPFPWIFPVAALGTVNSVPLVVLLAALGAATGGLLPYFMGHGLARHSQKHQPLSKIAQRVKNLSGLKKTFVVIGLSLSPIVNYPELVAGAMQYPIYVVFIITLFAEGLKVWLFILAFDFFA